MSLLAMLAWALFLCGLSLLIGYLLGIDRGRLEEQAMQSYRRHGDAKLGEAVAAEWSSRPTWRRP